MENPTKNYSWAKPFPEIQKACTLFNRTELLQIARYVYIPLTGYLQQGPQCGLVALAILMGSANKETVDRIFQWAKKMEFSVYGEMFSATWMAKLAEKFMPDARVEVHSGELDCDKIKEFLLSGGMMLVPYDNSNNFSPAQNNGNKPHWCAISGVLKTPENDFYVIARQGKSLNVGIWNLEDLSASNAQLTCQGPKYPANSALHNKEFIFPDGGVAGPLGLNEKAVLIYTFRADLIRVCDNV